MKKLVRNISILLIALLMACCLIVGFTACDDGSSSGSFTGQTGVVRTEDETGYLFEAECTNWGEVGGYGSFGTQQWRGYSANPMGPVFEAEDASGGYCCSNMYAAGCYLFFDFTSDAATTAELHLSLSMDYDADASLKAKSITLTDSDFKVYVNQTSPNNNYLEYGSIDYDMTKLSSLNTHKAFKEYDMGAIELQEGDNCIVLYCDNGIKGQGGTMSGTCPLIDYMWIDNTTATLDWTPKEVTSAAESTTLVR